MPFNPNINKPGQWRGRNRNQEETDGGQKQRQQKNVPDTDVNQPALPSPAKSAYQQNVSKTNTQNTVNTRKTPTANQMYGEIFAMGQHDRATAYAMDQEFQAMQADRSSPYWAPYTKPTNQAVGVLQSYGYDPSEFTRDWYENNTEWRGYLRFEGYGDTPKAPTKRSSKEEKIAYALWQNFNGIEDTEKAKLERDALREEVSYMAKDPNHNYSDEYIINNINWKKYPTLNKARTLQSEGKTLDLNEAIDMTDDDIIGWAWAARNNSNVTDNRKNKAMAALGYGQPWKENPEMQAKLDWNNKETYSPYSVGMTLDPEVGKYFGVYSFDRETLDMLRQTLDPNDDTAKKMYEQAENAWQTTQEAKKQRDALYAWVDSVVGTKSEDWITRILDKKLGSSQFSLLNDMDASIDNGSKLVQTTEAVDYSKRELLKYIAEKKAENAGAGTAPGIANDNASETIPGSGKSKDQIQQEAEDYIRRKRVAGDEVPGGENAAKYAYDEVNGVGAYDRDMSAAESVSSATQAQKDSDQYVNDTVGSFEEDMTSGESARLNGYSGSSEKAQAIITEKKNKYLTGAQSPEALISKNTAGITKNYVEGVLGVYTDTSRFEHTQYNLTQYKQTEEELLNALGDKVYYGKTQDNSFTMDVRGNKYRITMSPDMEEIEAIDNINDESVPMPVYASYGLYESPEEYDEDTRVWDAVEHSGMVAEFKRKFKEEGEKIRAAEEAGITEEDQRMLDSLRETQMNIEDAETYISENQAAYDQAMNEFARQSERREVHIQNLKDMGASTEEVETADAFLSFVSSFSEYEATRWASYNPSFAYSTRIEQGEDRNEVLASAEAEHNEILEQIKDIEWAMKYADRHQIDIPANYKENMNRRLEKLRRDATDYEFFAMQFAEDFTVEAEKGKSLEADEIATYNGRHRTDNPFLVPGSLYYYTGQYAEYMTDDEKNTFYYLKAKDEQNGTNKAEEYAKFLVDTTYGVLQVRGREATEQIAEDIVDSGAAGFVAGNVAAVLLSPYTAISSLAYLGYNAVTGREFNPNASYLTPMHFRSKTREESAKEIQEFAGENEVLQKVLQGGYEILTNRLDSAMNAAAFGWMFGGIEGEALQELLGAAPMGISAATEAAARAKERGASDAQAYGVAAVTLVAETVTEAISLENMSQAFKTGVTSGTYKEFLKNWLTKAGISEMVGESVNDIVENIADELIMGEMSDHANLVYEYRLKGYSKEDAELMARKDEISGVLRTALISYLSPGLDIVQTARGHYQSYGDMTRSLQENGVNVSLREVRKGVKQQNREAARAAREERNGPVRPSGEIDYDALGREFGAERGNETQQETQESTETQTAETEKQESAPDYAGEMNQEAQTEKLERAKQRGMQYTVDFEVLESAKGYDKAGKDAAISAVLDEGTGIDATETADAASVHLSDAFGEDIDTASEIQDLLTGAKVSDVDQGDVKQGITFAAIGGEDSASRQVVKSAEYKTATPDVKATMLAEAAAKDRMNAGINSNVMRAVHEDRVAKKMGALIAQGAAESMYKAQVEVDFAELDTKKARTTLETQQEVEQTARESLQRSAAESVQNPSNAALNEDVNKAVTELVNQGKVTQEYEQHLENMLQKENAARENANKIRQQTLTNIRQDAEAAVAQEDAARAQQRQEQQIISEQQAAEQESNDNAMVADVEDFIEKKYPNATEEQKQQLREQLNNPRVRDMANEISRIMQEETESNVPTDNTNIQDVSQFIKEMKNQDKETKNRDKVLKRVAEKYGLDIQTVDTTKGKNGQKVNRQEGYYVWGTNRIIIDKQTKLSDVMYMVLAHELTHVAENSETYTELANTLLQMSYGDDADYNSVLNQIKNGQPTSRLAQDVLKKKQKYDAYLKKMHEQDNSIKGDPISVEDALHEIVASEMGKLFSGNEKEQSALVKSLVSKNQGVARRILDSIKRFLRQNNGMKGEWVTNSQRAVDLLEKALKEAQGNRTKPVSTTNSEATQKQGNYHIDRHYYSNHRGYTDVTFTSAPSNDTVAALKMYGFKQRDNLVWRRDSGLMDERTIQGFINDADPSNKQYSLPVDLETENDNFESRAIVTSEDGEPLATELPGGTVAINDVSYSLNSFDEAEQERTRQALLDLKNEDGTNRFTKDEVDKYMEDALNIAKMISDDRSRLDFVANSHQDFLKSNDDYYFTLDASTLCAKRLLYQGTFDEVQHLMPDTVFMPEDLIDLVNIMREMGYETPCGICYVESRRRWLDKYAGEWLEKYDGEYKPSIDEVTTSDGLESLRQNPEGSPKRKAYDAFIKAMNAKGSANPKVVQLRTEYKGDIIKRMSDKDIQKVKDIGGLRVQSFSDFETPHLLDMIQAVYDMASVKLTSQAYTKVPNFAWVFGDTGIKINLSLIGKGTGVDADGNLVFDDVEGMPFEEAMKLRERYSKNVGTILVGINDQHIIAAMGDPRIDFIIPFHKSGWSNEEIRKVGTLNGYSDFTAFQNERAIVGKAEETNTFTDEAEMNKWIRNQRGNGMTNFDIRKSGNEFTVTATGYETKSFKKEADEKKAANKAEGKDEKVIQRSNFEPVGAHFYWDFKKSGQENAEAYLAMCKKDKRMPKFWQFLVDDGDYGFSLPQGTDKESTAIREGYWKTLTDFKMYENDGYGRAGGEIKGSPQTEVQPNINMNEAYRVMNEYKLGRQMPRKADGSEGAFIPMESNNALPKATPAAEMFVEHMKEKQARREAEAEAERQQKAQGIKVKKLTKAEKAMRQEQADLNALNSRLATAGYAGDLTLGEAESNQEDYFPEQHRRMAIDAETGETRIYSLPVVDPVQPSNDEWTRDVIQTFPELKATFPNMYNIQDDRTEEQKKNDTSIAGTVSTYRKIYDKLKKEGFNGTILDASSGMGLGTQAGRDEYGLNVDDIEPFPSPDYHPSEGTDYSKLNKKYDVIISNAVLNVLTQDERDALVTKMGQLLNNGGRMFINVRGVGDVSNLRKNIDSEWVKENGEPSPSNPYTGKKNIQIGDNEYYTGKGTYQKGFTPQELSSYILDVLGPDYSVTIDNKHETSGSSSAGIVVTKNSSDIRKYSLPSDAPYLSAVDHGDMDEAQRLVDEKAKEAGYDIEYAVWRGDFEPYNVLEPGVRGGNLGTGLYFTPQRSYAESFATRNSPVRKFYLKTGNTFDYDAFTQEFNDYAMSWIEENDGTDASSIASIDEYTWSMIWDDFISENGHDSVKATGVGGISYGAEEIAVQNSWQAKLADPVTYDDNGNVIPLSERFNDQNDDIRYSLPSEDTIEDEFRQYLLDGGSLNTVTERDQALIDSGVVTAKEMKSLNRSDKGTGYRQFHTQTAQQSDVTDERVLQWLDDHGHYVKTSNAKDLATALKWIRENATEDDPSGYEESVSKAMNGSFNRYSKEGQARMIALMGMAAAQGNTHDQLLLWNEYGKEGTNLAQAFQFRKMFTLMTPDGRKALMKRTLERAQADLERKGKRGIKLEFSDWIYQAAAAADKESDMKAVMDAAYEQLGEQIPANWADRLRSLRMFSMLANPRTHIRNFVGNMLFIPAVSMKNKLGAVAEIATKQGERTKTLALKLPSDIKQFAKEIAVANKDVLTGEAKYTEATRVKKAQNKLGEAFDFISDKNSELLEKEDWFFLKGHFRRAFGGWMVANGYTVDQVRGNRELMDKGLQYAVNEAQKATYRDFNEIASKLNALSQNAKTPAGKAFGLGVDALLPFKKTPANILRRGLEYSPAGIAKGLYNLAFHMKEYQDYANGKTSVLPDRATSPNQVIDQLCSGLSGTAIMALGYLLAGCGAVTCDLDDDKDKLDKEKGAQEYSINFGKTANSVFGALGIPKLFGEDVTYTMDWAAPSSMTLFVGAALRNLHMENGVTNVNDVVNALTSIAEPVFNLSMLDGINSAFKTSQYDDTNQLTQIGAKIGTNYVTSYWPSVFGSIARTISESPRKAYVKQGEGKGLTGTVNYAIEQTKNKIPFVNLSSVPIRNIWGEEKNSSFIERVFENFISPGYIEHIDNDPILSEMGRVFDIKGDPNIIPEDPAKSISFTRGGEKHEKILTAQEWDQLKTVRGQVAHSELTELMNTADYQNASASEQNQMIKNVWNHAENVARAAVWDEYDAGEAKSVSTIAKDTKIDSYKSEIAKALRMEDYDTYDTMVEAIRNEYDEAEDADAAIKRKVGDTFRDEWKAAYRDGDEIRMNEIEDILDYTGYDFNIYGKGGWMEKEDEKMGDSGMSQVRYSASNGISDVGYRKHYEGMDDYRGNIDIDHRPVLYNDDGTISTEESFSVGIDGKEVLLPTIINGKRVSEQEAINHYYETGDHLGIFDTPEEAEEYAERLHNRQDWYYHR